MENVQEPVKDRVISRKEFRKLNGNMSRSQEWRLLTAGKLPPPVRIDDRIIGYRESDWLEWLDKKTAPVKAP